MTPAGLVFTNSKTGVENLYIANKSLTKARALTNSTTRIINGTVDPKENTMIYTQQDGYGYQLEQAEMKTAKPPQIRKPPLVMFRFWN